MSDVNVRVHHDPYTGVSGRIGLDKDNTWNKYGKVLGWVISKLFNKTINVTFIDSKGKEYKVPYVNRNSFLKNAHEEQNIEILDESLKGAYRHYKGEAARKGDAKAQFDFGYLYEKEGYIDNAKEWYTKAADQGHVQAKAHLETLLLKEDPKKQEALISEAMKMTDPKQREALFLKVANVGNPQAQTELGALYKTGAKGIEPDRDKARKWYGEAIKLGYAPAKGLLGHMFVEDKDYKSAKPYLEQAAKADNPFGQLMYGYIHDQGLGVDKSLKDAKEWYLKAAQGGNILAQAYAGNMLKIEGNFSQAKIWLDSAARAGNQMAQVDLGDILVSEGKFKEALSMLLPAAQEGNKFAHFFVGYIYAVGGAGVPKDTEAAISWYEKSAKAGSATAKYNLGIIYQDKGDLTNAKANFLDAAKNGIATSKASLGEILRKEKDFENAEKWLKEAQQAGNPAATVYLSRLYKDLGKTDDAIALLKPLAEQGHPDAQYDFGLLLPPNEGKEWMIKSAGQKWQPARDWLKEGDLEAKARLGIILMDEKNFKEAVPFLREAAAAGNTVAQSDLGYIYQVGGSGVDKNLEVAIEFYKQAAAQGHVVSTYNLGTIYRDKNELTEAANYFRAAANKDYAFAKAELGRILKIKGEFAEAEEWLKTASAQGNEPGSFWLGELYRDRGEKEKAIELLRPLAEKYNDAKFELGKLLLPAPEGREWIVKAKDRGYEPAKKWLVDNP